MVRSGGDGLWRRRRRAAAGFPAPVQGTEGWIFDSGLVLPRQTQLHETEEVFEYLGIPLYAGLPVFIDAALQNLLGVRYLARMGFGVVVVVCPTPKFF